MAKMMSHPRHVPTTDSIRSNGKNNHPQQDIKNDDDLVRPFEWLTSPASLLPVIRSALHDGPTQNQNDDSDGDHDHDADPTTLTNNDGCHILHVGSGSSVLAEYLLEHEPELFPTDDQASHSTTAPRFHSIAKIVNVDKDQETLQRMEQRWNALKDSQADVASAGFLDKLEFCVTDLAQPTNEHDDNNNNANTIPYPDESFDMVLDKSTLDCLLCSDAGAPWLLHEVHRLLKPKGGIYLLISFHPLEMLLPMIQDCPGTDWAVTHSVLTRQVEDLINGSSSSSSGNKDMNDTGDCNNDNSNNDNQPNHDDNNADRSASLPDSEDGRKTVHVLVARRGSPRSSQQQQQSTLNFDAIYQHIQDSNDAWFKTQHPMLTPERQEEIFSAFGGGDDATNQRLPLRECYQILFTPAEREQLTYDYFLEDWHAFCEAQGRDESKGNHEDDLKKDSMTFDMALSFLNEMQ